MHLQSSLRPVENLCLTLYTQFGPRSFPASFGVPGYVIADFECLRHELNGIASHRHDAAVLARDARASFRAWQTGNQVLQRGSSMQE